MIPTVALVIATAVSASMLAVATWRYRATCDLLDPLVLFSGALVFYFGVHLLWLTVPRHFRLVETRLYNPWVAGIGPSTALLGMGYLFLLGGFFLRRRTRAGAWASAPHVARRYGAPALTGAYLVGLAAELAAAASGAYSKADNSTASVANVLTFNTLGFVAVVALVVAASQHYRDGSRPTQSRWLMWGMLGLQVVLGLAAAQKQIAFVAAFAWLVARNASGVRLTPRHAATAAVIAVFVVSPLIQSARTSGGSGQGTIAAVRSTAVTIPHRVGQYLSGLPDTALAGFTIINNRTNGTESLALAYLYTPSRFAYRDGRYWPQAITRAIPHYLLPGKSAFNASLAFSEEYAGEAPSEGFGLTIAPTLPGDLYINFGWSGILCGMCGVGVLLRAAANGRRRYATAGPAMYVAAMVSMLLVEQDVADIGSAIITRLLATAVAFGVLRLGSIWRPAPDCAGERDRTETARMMGQPTLEIADGR